MNVISEHWFNVHATTTPRNCQGWRQVEVFLQGLLLCTGAICAVTCLCMRLSDVIGWCEGSYEEEDELRCVCRVYVRVSSCGVFTIRANTVSPHFHEACSSSDWVHQIPERTLAPAGACSVEDPDLWLYSSCRIRSGILHLLIVCRLWGFVRYLQNTNVVMSLMWSIPERFLSGTEAGRNIRRFVERVPPAHWLQTTPLTWTVFWLDIGHIQMSQYITTPRVYTYRPHDMDGSPSNQLRLLPVQAV